MKKYLLLMLLVCFITGSIFAEIPEDVLYGSGEVILSPVGFDNSLTGGNNSYFEQIYDELEYNDNSRWYDDILIMSRGNPAWGKLSTDVNELSGDIFVSLLVPKTGFDDTVYTYRSQNGGKTWTSFWTYQGSSNAGEIIDQKIIVGHDAGGPWIYNFIMFDGSGSVNEGLWVHGMRQDATGQFWKEIIDGGDSLSNFSVDRNIENPQHFFIAYQTNNYHIRRIKSSDSCQTWGYAGYVTSNGEYPSVAAGGDGYVYIAYQDTSDYKITVLRYTNNQVSPGIKVTEVDSSSDGIYRPTVAVARTSPGTSQNAWLLYSRTNSIGNKSIRRTYTTDGGQTWISPFIWEPVNQVHTTWNMIYPYARVSYNNSLIRVVATIRETGYDSLVYAYAQNSTPDTWEDRAILNDNRITGEFGGCVSYSLDCSGGYIVYRQYGSPNIWFDAYNWDGIADKKMTIKTESMNLTPNPSRGKTILYYSINNEGIVNVSLYDVSGKMVERLFNGTHKAGRHSINIENMKLSPGVYFVRMETSDRVETKTLTILK